MSILRIFAFASLTVLMAGCASYFKVTDMTTGKEYYTEKVSSQGSAVQFTDEKTSAKTTLQNSQVLEIDKDTYKAGLAAKAAPAPAAGKVPAPVPDQAPAVVPETAPAPSVAP